MLDTVVISGEDVCCSVVFGTLVGIFVNSVICYELLMVIKMAQNTRLLFYLIDKCNCII